MWLMAKRPQPGLCAESQLCALQSAKDIEVPDGLLQVTVIEATNIPKGDYLHKSSPFVE